MSKKVNMLIVIVIITSILTMGCSSDLNPQNDKINERISQLEDQRSDLLDKIGNIEIENDNIKRQNDILQNKVDDLNLELSLAKDMIQEQSQVNHIRENEALRNKYDILPIYTANINTYEKEVKYYINMEKEISLEEKLEIIAQKLSKFSFNNLPIEVFKIEDIEGKKVAIVNLKEAQYNQGVVDPNELKGKTWRSNYFQGSTGGTITGTELIEGFLQREYSGKWIDGVKFLYHNEAGEFDHIQGIFEVNYR